VFLCNSTKEEFHVRVVICCFVICRQYVGTCPNRSHNDTHARTHTIFHNSQHHISEYDLRCTISIRTDQDIIWGKVIMLFNLAPSWSKPHAVRVLRGAANNKTQPEENELDSAEQTTQLRPHTTIREVVQVHFVSPQPLLAAIDLQARFNGCILLP
jgi:hypothetical protein